MILIKKGLKKTTNSEPVDNEDVINKAYLDEKLLKIDGHLSKVEKDYNEFKLQYNKQNVEDISIQRAVKTTIEILYDRGLFDNFQNADKVLEAFLFTTKRRPDLSEENTYSHLKHTLIWVLIHISICIFIHTII